MPLRFQRPELISLEQAARVHELAKRILREIGLEVRHERTLERLQAEGFRIRSDRVHFEPAIVEEHVEEMRRLIASRAQPNLASDDGRLALSVSTYSLYVHDIEADRVVPYTTDRLIEMCKLIDTLADDGVYGAPPGIPTDVHPDLHPIAQYRIAALYARQGATPVDPTSARTVNYLLDMAEVMGRPIRSLPVYMPSPLRLGGESLEVVLACLDRLSHIWVSSMPSTGATAPVHPFGALALAAAELMGGMVILHVMTGKPVTFGVGIFPFDLRTGAMVFGSPENLLFQMLCADFNRFYGWEDDGAPGNIHVMSKLPDGQSAADKAAIMAIGAFLGARHFSCAGTLSLDEVFSPEQLLLDCEIRDWVQRAIQGLWLGEEAVDDWLAEIRTGVERGFMGLNSTLDFYRPYVSTSSQHIWYPRRFERRAIGPWLSAGEPRLSQRLRDEVRRRIAAHDFELAADRRREIERIYQAACQAITSM
ncbi:MAG: trimethylamine methyltransferase family protein [Anaerolineae bacterium]|nr:trimethylamine methyltransferase family protein [Anaerolineae bacterium]